MKKSLLALAAITALTALPTLSHAEANPLSFNVSATTDYRYRGISQTRLRPALQGGADYAFPNGFYVGTWGSTIQWIKDAGGDAQVEIDIYGGFKKEIAKDLTVDVGLLQYWYPSAKTTAWDALYKDPNTTEIYGALSYNVFTFKLSYALTNLFGNYDFANGKSSKGSWYGDMSANFDIGQGITLTPHIGYQHVENIANASYGDYSLTVAKDFFGLTFSLAYVATDADKAFYVPGPAANSTKFLGKSALVFAVKKTF
jgi:uncharacterized protein (TIGR02001 family)